MRRRLQPLLAALPRRRTLLLAALLLAAALGLASCSNLRYYAQSLRGGAEVLLKRRPIPALLEDEETPPELREKLLLVQQLRDFAVSSLHLPDNRSYRTYADLDRPYAVWNVVAAPELSVEPLVWCFPIAGCVSYRGYFSEAGARRFAGRLRRRSYDVDVAGVTAYSTLGWFADPVLSTFIHLPQPDLAGILFHELAHQRLYVPDDTTFNESFATAVELEGVRRWLDARGAGSLMADYLEARRRQEEITELILAYRRRLAELYASEEPADRKRRRKEEILGDLRTAYRESRQSWDVHPGYDAWFAQDLNNAHLAAVGAYHRLLPAFQGLLASVGGDLEAFYHRTESLGALPRKERRERLGATEPPVQSGHQPP